MKNILLAILLLGAFTTHAQYDSKGNFGLGLGIDYGGIGGKLTFQPSTNLGLFLGVGYAFAGAGVNGGLQAVFNSKSRVRGYVTGMYGYNAALAISGSVEYKKLYYGPTFGAGIRLYSRNNDMNFWNFGLLLPIRDPKFQKDMDYYTGLGANLNNVPPIGISVGYHFGF